MTTPPDGDLRTRMRHVADGLTRSGDPAGIWRALVDSGG